MTVNRQMTMRELGALFEKHDFNAFPVVEDNKILGIERCLQKHYVLNAMARELLPAPTVVVQAASLSRA